MVSNTSSTATSQGIRGRRLVVCCDGTSNQPNRNNVTNVVKIARGVAPVDESGTSQIVFYDWGVGTSGKIDSITGGAFGQGLGKNVESAYRFLVHNYRPGDQIYLFGFSRGAFTARSVGGLIRQCSIIRKEHADRISEGYKLYRDPTIHPDHPDAEQFRSDFSQEMPLVEFIGVWDTVGALGIPANRLIGAVKYWTVDKWFGKRIAASRLTVARPGKVTSLPRNKHSFHDMTLSRTVKNAYHALAIDERRPVFTAATWQSAPKEYALPDGTMAKQVVKQAWFPGAHSDVGGGNSNVNNSSVSLNWIAGGAKASGLEFDAAFWGEVQRGISALGAISTSPHGVWRFAGSVQRDMSGNPGGTECIHPGARTREQDFSPKYNPGNLANSSLPTCE